MEKELVLKTMREAGKPIAAVLTHEEVEMLAIVRLAIYEVGNECSVTLLECCT